MSGWISIRYTPPVSSSRSGNCRTGLYCDSQQLQCIQMKEIGVSCDADKEYVHNLRLSHHSHGTLSRCTTYNCLSSGVCGLGPKTPRHVGVGIYAVVCIGIIGGEPCMILMNCRSFIAQTRNVWNAVCTLLSPPLSARSGARETNAVLARTGQFDVTWSLLVSINFHQNAFHQSLAQMRQTARHSILSLGNGNSAIYADNLDDSQQPTHQVAPKASGLRYLDESMGQEDPGSFSRHDEGRF